MTFTTKYDIGDVVWFEFMGNIRSATIISVTINKPFILYNFKEEHFALGESKLFATREELIENTSKLLSDKDRTLKLQIKSLLWENGVYNGCTEAVKVLRQIADEIE